MPDVFLRWFAGRGWRVRDHQLTLLGEASAGHSALLIAPTGGGKTLAGFLPTLVELSQRGIRSRNLKPTGRTLVRSQGLHTLYISPLKALAVDIARNLEIPVQEMRLPVRIETRTGDTPTSKRQRQRRDPPDILLTTPEQLALLLASADAPYLFGTLVRVVLDELHSLVMSKRGDLLSLGLARLFNLAPELTTIGLSATGKVKVSGRLQATLIFVNTRSQAEFPFQELWRANEDNLAIALHHGSLDVAQRRRVEDAMAAGKLRAVVCTSSLDLGVDWGDIDLVINVGAPKGCSRLMQRIGRSNHRLDEPSEAVLVPANRFEVLECRAAIDAVAENAQDTPPLRKVALDELDQHILARA